jgi:hypothetical protein
MVMSKIDACKLSSPSKLNWLSRRLRIWHFREDNPFSCRAPTQDRRARAFCNDLPQTVVPIMS